MLNENTGKFLKEKRKNQVKEDNRERKKEKREQIVLTEEQNKSKKEIVQEKEESLKSQTWQVINKFSRALPDRPKESRCELLKSLLKSPIPNTKQKVTTNNVVPYNILSEETTNLVNSFYEDDSTSRVMPGKKDVLLATNSNSTKIKKRKRLLLDDISEVHQKQIIWVMTAMGDSSKQTIRRSLQSVYTMKMLIWFWKLVKTKPEQSI